MSENYINQVFLSLWRLEIPCISSRPFFEKTPFVDLSVILKVLYFPLFLMLHMGANLQTLENHAKKKMQTSRVFVVLLDNQQLEFFGSTRRRNLYILYRNARSHDSIYFSHPQNMDI